jgi:hypothetical protein
MSRVAFKEADVTRALKAARKAGYVVDRASINRAGDIDLVFRTEAADNTPRSTRNPWDEVLPDAANEKRSS